MGKYETAAVNNYDGGQGGLPLPALLYSSILIILFALLYAPAYRVMFAFWQGEDYNHCYFVPLVALYIIWEMRTAFRDAAYRPSWLGLAPVVFGIALYWLGELGGEFYTLYLSSWFVMIGIVWMYSGWHKLKVIAFPLCFLIAMFPFPRFITNGLTLKLKLISSQLGVLMLRLTGLSAYREGNVIDLGFTRLQVVDACSGLRFFLPLIILSILLSYYYRAPWWKRALLVVSAIPLSIFTNSLRIASVGILYQFWGPTVAEGFFHDFSGWFIFMVSLAMLLSFMWCLRRFLPEPAQVVGEESARPFTPPGAATRRVSLGYSLVLAAPVIVMLGGSLLLTNSIDFREKAPLTRAFADFPVQVGAWQGSRQVMEKMYLDQLDLTDYILADYRNGNENQTVNFYVAYKATQSKGKASHSPATCLPGGGWDFKDSGTATVELASGSTITMKRAVMEKNGQQQLVYYWFPQRGRILHNLFELKFYAFWDALISRRTDGALVRVITRVKDPSDPREADALLQGFVKMMTPILDRYIAGKTI